MKYDFLIIGSGLFGATFARIVTDAGYKVKILEARNHIGGNVFTEDVEGVTVHKYGPHLFHTGNEAIWKFVHRFSEFNDYHHKVKANYDGEILSLPFNMETYRQLWGCLTPAEAKVELDKRKVAIANPTNLEEWCLSQVGEEIYQKLVYGYTKKHWMRDPKQLPASIIRRLPLRMTYDDNYFNDRYQGIPVDGYTKLIENMIGDIPVKLNTDFFEDDVRSSWKTIANKLVYSGPIDQYYDYKFGDLEYRSLEFKNTIHDGDVQGMGQMNYTSMSVPYTRVVEHKHFYFAASHLKSVVTHEYPVEWKRGLPRYYPINDQRNTELYNKYKHESQKEDDVIIGGRLGRYMYFDMDQTIGNAIHLAEREIKHVDQQCSG